MRPFHIFSHLGGRYIINIEKMAACAIDDETAGLLERLTTEPAAAIEPRLEEKLKSLELLSESGDQRPRTRKEEEPIPILNLCLFLTQTCNLKCIYCYGEEGAYGTGGDMDERTAFQAVDWLVEQAGAYQKLHIGFFGGEPFLRFPLMAAVVEYAAMRAIETGRDLDFYATTNATLLNDEIIAFMREHRMNIMVSFDGTREAQDTQRPFKSGRGSYDVTVPGIKKLLAVIPEAHGHAVIVGNTNPQDVKDAMEEIGFSMMTIIPASRSLFTEEPDKEKQARDTLQLIREMEEEAESWIALIRNGDGEALKNLMARSALYCAMTSLLHNSKIRHACGAGRGLAAVSSSGDIYLCHRFVGREDYRLGSVFEKDLQREEYQKSPIAGNKLCSACFARYYCAGGCKHDNVGACGDLSTPSEDMCRIKRLELELAATVTCRLSLDNMSFLVKEKIFPPKPCPLDLFAT